MKISILTPTRNRPNNCERFIKSIYNTAWERGAVELIENRYKDSIQKSTDFRYYHKVFYYDKYVLKFHYPCKASLDKKTFDSTIPTASKEQLLTILKTNDFLYENGINCVLFYMKQLLIWKLFLCELMCLYENMFHINS